MSYAFVNVTAVASVDEYGNPVNSGACVVADGVEEFVIRPDMPLDYCVVTLPHATDGTILNMHTFQNIWTLELDAPETTTQVNGPADAMSLVQGAVFKLIYVEAEDTWYVLAY